MIKNIQPLTNKVILVTGGTAGLGRETIKALVLHNPAHIYFTGRNASAATTLITEIQMEHPEAALTFIEMDLSSLLSVKNAILRSFKHDHLDILINNAGIISKPPILSVDGYEIQFATNYLGHAMITKHLLPFLLKAGVKANSDVRIINLSSEGYALHRMIKGGISFTDLDNGSVMDKWMFGPLQRYGQSKLANILFTFELARRYPQITSVVIHPGVVKTPMVTEMRGRTRWINTIGCWVSGIEMVEPDEGVLNTMWSAVGAAKKELRSGAYYLPIGKDATENLQGEGKNMELAKRLWEWTEGVLKKFD